MDENEKSLELVPLPDNDLDRVRQNALSSRPNGRPRTINPIGKPGHPTAGWQRRCRLLAKRLIRNGTASKVLDDDRHPHWFSMVKLLVEQGHGKAVETVRNEGGQVIEIVVRHE